jgi:hypothetical protein
LLVGLSVGVLGFTSTLLAGVREPYVPDTGLAITQTQSETCSYSESRNTQAWDQLSPAARVTVKRIIGNDDIRSVKLEAKAGAPDSEVYRVELVKRPGARRHATLEVAQDGTLVRESHMGNAESSQFIVVPESGAASNR